MMDHIPSAIKYQGLRKRGFIFAFLEILTVEVRQTELHFSEKTTVESKSSNSQIPLNFLTAESKLTSFRAGVRNQKLACQRAAPGFRSCLPWGYSVRGLVHGASARPREELL